MPLARQQSLHEQAGAGLHGRGCKVAHVVERGNLGAFTNARQGARASLLEEKESRRVRTAQTLLAAPVALIPRPRGASA